MATIKSPLNPQDTGDSVKPLHEALLFIAAKLTIPGLSDLLKDATFLNKWNEEFKASIYGDATQQAVKLFQQQQGIEPTGVVDEPTATAINNVVATSSTPAATSTTAANTTLQVSGTVYNEWIEPMVGAPVMEL